MELRFETRFFTLWPFKTGAFLTGTVLAIVRRSETATTRINLEPHKNDENIGGLNEDE